MKATRAFVLVAVVVLSTITAPAAAAGTAATPSTSVEATQPSTATPLPQVETGTDEPTTSGTIGYVEGYWYNDSLPADDRDDGVLEEGELEAVVYRAMARVEVIREKPFQEAVSVDVITREEFEAENGDTFGEFEDDERLYHNVRFEALFMVDRDTDAVEEYRAMYDSSVAGYYDPATDEIVLVSDTPETPATNEVTLGHELVHALQDQYVGLEGNENETRDEANARNGLIEGEAVWVDTEYEDRCQSEWDCVLPDEQRGGGTPQINWGIYFTVFQPYDDGPEYIDYLREQGGWDAVDAAYDDPPASSSEVIRPGEEREPTPVEIEDRSTDRWERLETDEGPGYSSFGEATMAAMFADGAVSTFESSVVGVGEFVTFDDEGYVADIDYDQPYTDGWAGDRLVAYATDERTIEESGYVWRTEWTSESEAEQFLDGYLELLDIHDAEPVDGRQDTVVIDDGHPGAYYVDHDGTTVTIVRAPSVDELPEIREGAAPAGEDTLAFAFEDANETDDADDPTGTDDESDELPGFGVVAALVGVLVAVTVARRR